MPGPTAELRGIPSRGGEEATIGPPASEDEILRAVDEYYSARLRDFGPVHLGVDWISRESQELRFDVLLQAVQGPGPFSLLDYGCGYGALADRLAVRRMRECEYIGYDISAAMLDVARRRPCPLPRCRFVGPDEPLPEVDYCVASGVFNVSLGTEPDRWWTYMTGVWDEMHRLSRRAFAFNCLSADAAGDRRPDLLHYADPAHVFDHCRRAYSPRAALLHDYPLAEFTVIVRKCPV